MNGTTNGDKTIGILRNIANNCTLSSTTRELAEFILMDIDMTKDINRVSALMVICQFIFESHPDALVMMNTIVFKHLQP
jgi:hypothetical protein